MPQPFDTADQYIDAQPQAAQTRLRELQAIVHEVLPDAAGVISYGMPTYRFPGGALYFGAGKRHVAVYGFATEPFKDELSGFQQSKGTVRFPLDRPIPSELVRKMAQATVASKQAV